MGDLLPQCPGDRVSSALWVSLGVTYSVFHQLPWRQAAKERMEMETYRFQYHFCSIVLTGWHILSLKPKDAVTSKAQRGQVTLNCACFGDRSKRRRWDWMPFLQQVHPSTICDWSAQTSYLGPVPLPAKGHR